MNTKEIVKCLGTIEYVAITPWGWIKGSSPLEALRGVLELASDEEKMDKKWEKNVHLWMVLDKEWDRINGWSPANKDGTVGVCLYGFTEEPEWRDQIYVALSEAYEKWATAAV